MKSGDNVRDNMCCFRIWFLHLNSKSWNRLHRRKELWMSPSYHFAPQRFESTSVAGTPWSETQNQQQHVNLEKKKKSLEKLTILRRIPDIHWRQQWIFSDWQVLRPSISTTCWHPYWILPLSDRFSGSVPWFDQQLTLVPQFLLKQGKTQTVFNLNSHHRFAKGQFFSILKNTFVCHCAAFVLEQTVVQAWWGLARVYPPPCLSPLSPVKLQVKMYPPGEIHPPADLSPPLICHPPARLRAWRWRQRSTLAFVAKSLVSAFVGRGPHCWHVLA